MSTRVQGAVETLLRRRVAEHPNQTWLKWRDTTFTWSEILSGAQRVANGLLELGTRPGDAVVLLIPNSPEFLLAHFGSLMIGALPVPVNTAQRGITLQHIVADSTATTAVVHADLVAELAAVRDDCPVLRHVVVVSSTAGRREDWSFERLLSSQDREPEAEVTEALGATGLMYTSGTTGPPKGVVATGYDMAPLVALLQLSGIQPGETMYTALPLFHGNALLISTIGSMFLDARLALDERFSASRLFDRCRQHDAVSFNALGGMISILLKQQRKRDDANNPVRTVISAGCPPDRWREFEHRFGVEILEFYGMVDAPGCLVNADGRVGSMGTPVAGVEFRVVDDAGRPVEPGQVGELIFRHPRGQLTQYHRLPDATDYAYRGGWFHSGDLAEQDTEGHFYYRGRKTESMRRLGENISAWEIETTLNQHPAVLECAAHAVPSDLGEDEVKITVVLAPGASATPDDLIDHCAAMVAKHAVPRFVEFVDELPKTATHRVQYAVLRNRGVTPATWDRQTLTSGRDARGRRDA